MVPTGGPDTLDRSDGVVLVGLTGGLGAGKSTALRMFADEGALTFSADEAVTRVYESSEVKSALRTRYGDRIFDRARAVDRKRLAEAVRDDREELDWLEHLVHPRVAEEMRRVVRGVPSGTVVVCEIPLLVESAMQDDFDLVVSIEAPTGARMKRVVDRMDGDSFRRLDARQASRSERIDASHFWFENDEDPEALRAFVQGVYQRALRIGERAKGGP